jgi:hypothetical protein
LTGLIGANSIGALTAQQHRVARAYCSTDGLLAPQPASSSLVKSKDDGGDMRNFLKIPEARENIFSVYGTSHGRSAIRRSRMVSVADASDTLSESASSNDACRHH